MCPPACVWPARRQLDLGSGRKPPRSLVAVSLLRRCPAPSSKLALCRVKLGGLRVLFCIPGPAETRKAPALWPKPVGIPPDQGGRRACHALRGECLSWTGLRGEGAPPDPCLALGTQTQCPGRPPGAQQSPHLGTGVGLLAPGGTPCTPVPQGAAEAAHQPAWPLVLQNVDPAEHSA